MKTLTWTIDLTTDPQTRIEALKDVQTCIEYYTKEAEIDIVELRGPIFKIEQEIYFARMKDRVIRGFVKNARWEREDEKWSYLIEHNDEGLPLQAWLPEDRISHTYRKPKERGPKKAASSTKKKTSKTRRKEGDLLSALMGLD
tara:strand:- start:619 stop:1047 length:429 start_codon:yes stop_codon:yes gene_type:complete